MRPLPVGTLLTQMVESFAGPEEDLVAEDDMRQHSKWRHKTIIDIRVQ